MNNQRKGFGGILKKIWQSIPYRLRLLFRAIACLLLSLVIIVFAGWWYLNPTVSRTNGVVYGNRNGTPLTLDVLQPANANGRAIALMVSGGWRSKDAGETPVWMLAPVLRRGYTVFAICHVSQPEASVQEIIEDMHRGIRFIRHNAEEYKIDPERIGVSGGSAGGHLSLMLATRGGPGDANSSDPIDRESSEVQAVAIFYPVTDLTKLEGSTTDPGELGGPPLTFRDSFGPDGISNWDEIAPDCSPIYHLNESLPPTLIYHGDADPLVILDQSQRYQTAARKLGNRVELIVQPGGVHGWPTMLWDVRHFASWFDEHL